MVELSVEILGPQHPGDQGHQNFLYRRGAGRICQLNRADEKGNSQYITKGAEALKDPQKVRYVFLSSFFQEFFLHEFEESHFLFSTYKFQRGVSV